LSGGHDLLIHYGGSRFLLTGDIEQAAEAAMLRRGFDLPVTMMTAPHHGSDSSSSAAFVKALQPQHVVVPAGRANRYDFPHLSVLARYT